jgi:hypothetical protein
LRIIFWLEKSEGGSIFNLFSKGSAGRLQSIFYTISVSGTILYSSERTKPPELEVPIQMIFINRTK